MLIISGLTLFLAGLYLAFGLHSTVWYSAFVIGGFLLFEGINRRRDFSVLAHPKNFLLVWGIFIAITIGVEFLGNYWFDFWNYPSFNTLDYLINVILIGYAFTGFFGLTFLVFLQQFLHSKAQQVVWLPIAAFLFGYFNEYPNTFAYEWIYVDWPLGEPLGIPVVISILWIALLLVLLFKRFFQANSFETNAIQR